MALVLMPEGPAFRSWYSPEALRDAKNWVEQLGRDNDAPVIDAREWLAKEEDFTDSVHLVWDGANRFTDRLGQEIIIPLLRNQSGAVNSAPASAGRPTLCERRER